MDSNNDLYNIVLDLYNVAKQNNNTKILEIIRTKCPKIIDEKEKYTKALKKIKYATKIGSIGIIRSIIMKYNLKNVWINYDIIIQNNYINLFDYSVNELKQNNYKKILYSCIQNNKIDMILLLNDIVLKKLINETYDGECFLWIAVNYSNYEIVKLLVEKGFTSIGRSCPISRAIYLNNFKILKFLIEKGINHNNNLLSEAVGFSNLQIVQYLADVKLTLNLKPITLTTNCDIRIVKILIKNNLVIIESLMKNAYDYNNISLMKLTINDWKYLPNYVRVNKRDYNIVSLFAINKYKQYQSYINKLQKLINNYTTLDHDVIGVIFSYCDYELPYCWPSEDVSDDESDDESDDRSYYGVPAF